MAEEAVVAEAASSSSPGTLRRSYLRGHKDSVLTLAADGRGVLLASGSADGSCRLWDLRAKGAAVRSVRAALVGGEVSAVALSSQDEHLLLAAAGTDLLSFDLRSERVLLQGASRRLEGLASEDINQVAIEPAGAFAAVAEDGGSVHLVDLRSFKRERSYAGKRGHRNICSSVAFRPGREWGLASGGLDSTVCLWQRSGRSRQVQMQVDAGDDASAGAGGPQLCNPPFVHSVAYTPDGEEVVAGLGDGSLAVISADSGDLHHRLRGGHSSAACQVVCTPAGLLSAGIDRKLCLWAPADAPGKPPRLALTVDHTEKVNWIAWSDGRLFVADCGNNIACYDGLDR